MPVAIISYFKQLLLPSALSLLQKRVIVVHFMSFIIFRYLHKTVRTNRWPQFPFNSLDKEQLINEVLRTDRTVLANTASLLLYVYIAQLGYTCSRLRSFTYSVYGYGPKMLGE